MVRTVPLADWSHLKLPLAKVVGVRTTLLPGPLHSEGAGAVHGEVSPPGDEEAGTAEGGVAHDDGLGGEGDAGPGAEVDRGHQAGEASYQVNNSTASIVHGAQLVQPTIGGPVRAASQSGSIS